MKLLALDNINITRKVIEEQPGYEPEDPPIEIVKYIKIPSEMVFLSSENDALDSLKKAINQTYGINVPKLKITEDGSIHRCYMCDCIGLRLGP